MKKIILISILIALCNSNLFSQSGWQEVYNYESSKLNKIIFLNDSIGFTVGYHRYDLLITKTTNGGLNWGSYHYATSSFELLSICFADNNTGYAVGGSLFEPASAILKTTNQGNSWNYHTIIGFENYTFWDIKFSNSLTGYISGTDGLILKTTDKGISWIQQFTGITNSIRKITISPDNPDVIFGAGNSSFVMRTVNGGINWQRINFPDGEGIYNLYLINSNTGYVSGRLTSYPYSPLLYKSTNQGDNWVNLNSNLPAGNGSSLILFSNENTGYFIGPKINKTTNGGLNWRTQESYPWATNNYDIFFLNNNFGFIVCSWQSIENGIIIRTNSGGDSPPNPPSDLNCSRNNIVNKLFWIDNSIIETGFKIQRRNIQDSLWETIDSVNSNVRLYYDTLEVDSVIYRVFAYNEFGNSSYSNEAVPVIIIVGQLNQAENLPSEYTLLQNYPNPFNPSTNLEFGISELGFVSLKVYDALGKVVRTLVNENKRVGNYNIKFDGSDLPSGIYFYRLEAGKFIETKRMILIK